MRRLRSSFAGNLSALAVSLPLWVAIAPSATAGSFVGDMLVTNDREPGVILAFDPSTGAYQGIFANLGPDYDAQTLAQGPNGNIYVTSPQGAVFRIQRCDGAAGWPLPDLSQAPTHPFRESLSIRRATSTSWSISAEDLVSSISMIRLPERTYAQLSIICPPLSV